MKSFFKKHWQGMLAILASGLVFLYPASKIFPFEADNLGALSIGLRSPGTFFTNQLATYFPAYRPIAQFSIWIQYQIIGLRSIESYFWVNLALLLIAGFLIYLIVYHLAKSQKASFLAALIFILNYKIMWTLVWIGERQNLLCIIFGLAAILSVIIFSRKGNINFWQLALTCFFLLLSFLCKEYAITFAVVVLALGVKSGKCKGRLPWVFLGSVAVTILLYLFLRFVIAKGGAAPLNYCEEIGYFYKEKSICYSNLDALQKLSVYAYNITATFFGTYMPFIFSKMGRLDFSITFTTEFTFEFIALLLILFFNVWAVIKNKVRSFPFVLAIIINALISFMVYRERNHLVALTGVAILAGLGYEEFLKIIKPVSLRQAVSFAALALIFFSFGFKIKDKLYDYQDFSKKFIPDHALIRYPLDVNSSVVQEVDRQYSSDIRIPEE